MFYYEHRVLLQSQNAWSLFTLQSPGLTMNMQVSFFVIHETLQSISQIVPVLEVFQLLGGICLNSAEA